MSRQPAADPAGISPATVRRARRRMRHDRWRAFVAGRRGVVGLVIIALYGLGALAHPILLATVWDPQVYDPVTGHSAPRVALDIVDQVTDPSRQIDLARARLRHDPAAAVGDTVEVLLQPAPPSARHLLGTDPRGRDVLSQLLYSARVAFGMAVVAAVATVVVATVLAATAAYRRGWVDATLTRFAEVFVLLPALPLVIFLSALHDLNVVTLGVVFGLVSGLGPTALVLRAQALPIASAPYVEAARAAGGGTAHVIRVHMVPNVLPLSLLYAMFTVAAAIAAEAILSLFGLLSLPMSWGIMINVADTGGYVTRVVDYWWLVLPAGLAVSVLAAAFYVVGRGLDEAIDPRLRRVRS